MPLFPTDPLRRLDRMRQELDRLFAEELPVPGAGFPGFGGVELRETDDEVVAACRIPGATKIEDVRVAVRDNLLHIDGSVNHVSELKSDRLYRRESFVGRYRRAVPLPCEVAPEGIRASCRDGLVTVRLRKKNR